MKKGKIGMKESIKKDNSNKKKNIIYIVSLSIVFLLQIGIFIKLLQVYSQAQCF